jgi:FtsZ-binding cell division protein ZapB
MGLIAKEKYEQRKVDRLADHLKIYYEKGQPIDFEIIVDGFKVVRRTSDIGMFGMYENYVDADTKSIEFLFYSGNSNSNDKHIFLLSDVSVKPASLDGINVEEEIKSGVNQKLRDIDFEKLQGENKELEAEVKELEKEVDRLEKENEILQASKSPLNGVLGNLGSSLIESFIKRNPKIMATIPGGEALAGLLDSDPSTVAEVTEDAEVSFKPKSQGENQNIAQSPLSEEERYALIFVGQLKAQFTKVEFDKIRLILDALADDKQRFDIVFEHLNIQPK